MSILLVILSASTVGLLFLYVTCTKELKVARDERDGYCNQTILAEREAARAETELQYMKLTLTQVLQRPAVAVISDDNLQQFAAVIESILKSPDRMN